MCSTHIVKLKSMRCNRTVRGVINRTSNLLGVVGLAVANRIEDVAREVLGRAGETPAALVVIGYDTGPSNDQLRQVLGLSHTGTVRLVDRLVADGLVKRRPGRDKREIALFATKRGKAVREALLKGRLAGIQPMLEPLTRGEQETLAALLHKMLASMDTTDMQRKALCRLCDDRVCDDCPIPADKAVD